MLLFNSRIEKFVRCNAEFNRRMCRRYWRIREFSRWIHRRNRQIRLFDRRIKNLSLRIGHFNRRIHLVRWQWRNC